MSDQSTPMVPVDWAGLGDRVVRWVIGHAIGLSLLVSPRPAALLIRRVFTKGGEQTARGLARHAPSGVSALRDQRYGTDADMVLDVYSPQGAPGPLPVVVWVHGGGFLGGSKEELADYFALIASKGYVVIGPRYSLAPEHHYPTPLRQVMQVLSYADANAARLGLDPARIVLAGDSAGAQLTAPGMPRRSGCSPRSCRPSCGRSSSRAARTTWRSPGTQAPRPGVASCTPWCGPTPAHATTGTTRHSAAGR